MLKQLLPSQDSKAAISTTPCLEPTGYPASHAAPDYLKPFALIWLLLCVLPAVHVIQSWYSSIANKTLNEDLLLVIALVITGGALRHYLTSAPPLRLSFDNRGAVVLTAMAVINCAANYLHLFRIYWLSFGGMAFGLLWALAGKRYTWHWLPLFLFSAELMPGSPIALVSSCSAWLRLASVKIATTLAALFIPITVQGNSFYIKSTALQVSNACSGLSMLTGLIFVVLLRQLIKPMRLRNVLCLLCASAVVAVLANGVRLCITALVAYYSSIDAAVAIHTDLEYFLFPAAMLLLWWCERVLPE